MEIREVRPEDFDAVCAVEESSFPPEEGASPAAIRARIETYPECFWVAVEDGRVIGHINGIATERRNLEDEMYANARMHDPQGSWQMIFSVAVLPAWRGRQVATRMMRRMIAECRERGRTGAVLTCKERLIPFYAGFGFLDEGVSGSTHGGVIWHQMRLVF